MKLEVFSRQEGRVITNLVTDPYSLGLSADSLKSLVVDLNSPLSQADLLEFDSEAAAGESNGRRPLRTTYPRLLDIRQYCSRERSREVYWLHSSLLPRHDAPLASRKCGIDTRASASGVRFRNGSGVARSDQKVPEILVPISAPDSAQPQAAIATVKDQDGFNWGYDPYHYGTPEGSYSTSPAGPTRIREFREMVKSFHLIGLRVVMDVVYNHTVAAGQDTFSVLDKVVPGYYYRLDQNGDVYTNAFGPGTASEHRMFSKLMLDTLKMWAEEYQVDGFRFDLMSFSFKDNMLEIKKALHEIDPTIYLYGEGWDFGEVANNAFGENATQANMAGTGIGYIQRPRPRCDPWGRSVRPWSVSGRSSRVYQWTLVRQ